MFDFLLRLFFSTIKFVFRVFVILGGAVFSGLVNAALSILTHVDEGEKEMPSVSNLADAERAYAAGEIDGFGLRAYRDMYED
ncbi:hypothetical protein [Xylophilus sp. ASV27]|uniref:hypothetical protein n=1 Tax=Xylophilus sp. ASV27 TaxID=2795129 RepID=UPI0018EA39A7|nr:hypothetical protein [Xylophilus sp. ASV27]